MDMITGVMIACVLFFAYRGYKAGFVLSLGRIASLVAGYGAALLLSQALSAWLQQQLGWSAPASLIIASLGLFIVISGGVNSLVKFLFRRFPKTFQRSWFMRWGGAGVGATGGYLAAVVTLWFYTLLLSTINVASPTMGERLQKTAGLDTAEQSLGQQLVQKTTTVLANTVLEASAPQDPVAQATAMLMAHPQSTLEILQRLSQNSHLNALLKAPGNQQVIAAGDTQAIVALKDFKQLKQDPDMQLLFGEDKITDQQMAQLLVTYWRRAEHLSNDQELQQLLQDPELQKKLQQGNPMAVLTHPGGRKLLGALLKPIDENTDPANSNSPSTASPPEEPDREPATSLDNVHRWVDDEGRTHFSDQPQ